MHIKKIRKTLLHISVWTVVLAVLGTVTYRELFFDEAKAAEVRILEESKKIQNPVTSKEYGIKRAEIALSEYRKNIVETTKNCNCGPEIDKYTEGNPMQWCTMFASWVTKEAGSPVANNSVSNPSWRIVNSQDFAKYLQDNGTWYSKEEIVKKGLQPQIGDFIVYFRGRPDERLGHVDVVVNIRSMGHADLIGGNLDERIKFREDYNYLDNHGFLGFGRPEKN